MILLRSVLFFLFVSLTISTQARAFPQAPFNALGSSHEIVSSLASVVALDSSADIYDFNGIVRLSNCSGFLIMFEGQPSSSNALVLTNGHCYRRFIRAEAIVLNQPSRRTMRVSDANKRFHTVRATTVVYATMTGTDVLLYRLKETYDELATKNITPLMLSPVRPQPNAAIQIISGYWKRGYSCFIDGFVHKLLEASWEFYDSLRYSTKGCDIIGGTSGSPVILKGTRQVVGINNTLNENGRRCNMNNPCEVDEDGNVTVDHNRGYGQQTYIFYSCLDSDYEIDLTLQGCQLAKGASSLE